ncbi:hypothetical protein CWC46_17120 [Prodigiosinella confusarubida]|uniref:Uncharacterized protein n=1 Tax=Serratia sp. (strain ATCC 39006) TaxID=104623 RepID=A0A2I5TMB3_SERS3|nr:hypothetical protein CWC46_17120 [Serratia sp. ATCC 39006]AUH05698.1 hypothetical protein Ser39006_017120 [Serratia sp. ATCC 39006]
MNGKIFQIHRLTNYMILIKNKCTITMQSIHYLHHLGPVDSRGQYAEDMWGKIKGKKRQSGLIMSMF